MSAVAISSKQAIKEYLQALSGQAKTTELMDRYIIDPKLKEHISQAEAAFPEYEVVPNELIAEGDLVAARCTFRGIHRGDFAGIPPTGKHVSSDFMIFYKVSDGMITEHWMQMDMKAVMDQLIG